MKRNKENAFFFQRVMAFLIDVMIVYIITTLVATPFVNQKSAEKLQKEETKIMQNYIDKKTDVNTYINQSMDLNYEIARNNGIITIVSIALTIIYFVVYQFFNKGQTLGKRIFKIKIKKVDGSALNMNDLVYRSLIINGIFANMIMFAITIFCNKQYYFYTTTTVQLLQNILFLICVFMIMYRKDGRGLHDLVANTVVVKCEEK